MLEAISASYRRRGLGKIGKTDPPSRIVGNPVVFQRNPWLDYVDAFRVRRVVLEAKSHTANRLPIRRNGGQSERQVDSLLAWADEGSRTRRASAGKMGLTPSRIPCWRP